MLLEWLRTQKSSLRESLNQTQAVAFGLFGKCESQFNDLVQEALERGLFLWGQDTLALPNSTKLMIKIYGIAPNKSLGHLIGKIQSLLQQILCLILIVAVTICFTAIVGV